MLRLPEFEYLVPKDIDDAVSILGSRGADAMLVAGGTDVFPNMKRRQFEPRFLVGLSGLSELRGLRHDNGDILVGAGTTLTILANHRRLRERFPALASAAGLVSSPQLRNTGTIGGNLCLDTRCNYYDQSYFWRKSIDFCMKKDGETCWVAPGGKRCWAISSADCAPVAVALNARVRLVGPKGERDIPASDLYRDDGMDYIAKSREEVLTELVLPSADGLRSTYLKLRRRGSIDFPILGVAAALRIAPNGLVEHARIVLGAIASHPVQAVEAERLLVGQKLSQDVITAAAEAAYKPAKPMDNADLNYAWRKKMVRVYVARALEELAGLS